MTRSAGHTGLIFSGSPPSLFTASRIAAKSTTAGTPLLVQERQTFKMKKAGTDTLQTEIITSMTSICQILQHLKVFFSLTVWAVKNEDGCFMTV